ncbi:MAG TPA: ABC transporter permease subunit, partial [Thermoleophilia bacterium]|nr:ABC transporter permease subunit [Thermoleophilia bacterium]
ARHAMRNLGHEFRKLLAQKRTYLGWAGLLAIPVLMVLALYLSNSNPHGEDEGPPFLDQVLSNGMFVPLSAIAVLSFFLLPMLASMAGAYPIAGEAEQGTMKTWLSRPVSRTTVLLSKWGVAIIYVIIGMLLVWGGGLLAGGLVFGLRPLVTLSGTTVSIAHGLWLTFLVYGLILLAMVCVISLAALVSTFTNSSLTAAIVAMVIFIVLSILNGFSYFDFMKPYTFTAYSSAFLDLFRDPIYWPPIRDAVLTYVATIAGVTLLAWYIFRRRDILT